MICEILLLLRMILQGGLQSYYAFKCPLKDFMYANNVFLRLLAWYLREAERCLKF